MEEIRDIVPQSSDDIARQMVLDLKHTADERRRQRAEDWVRFLMLYLNKVIRGEIKTDKAMISVPWAYIVVETYLPKSINFLLGVLPYVLILAEHSRFETNSRFTEKLINKQLYLQRFPIVTTRIFKDAFVFGTAFPLIEPWSACRGMGMPRVMPTRIFDCWPSPYVSELDDPEAWMIHRSLISRRSLLAMANRANYRGVREQRDEATGQVVAREIMTEPVYRNLDLIRPREKRTSAWDDEYSQRIDAYLGRPSQPNDEHTDLVELHTYYDRERIIVVANEEVVIRDTPNPIGQIPFKKITPIPAPTPEFFGLGLFEMSETQFWELNETRSQRLDARNIALNPMWQSKDPSLMGRRIESGAGKIISSIDGSLTPIKMDWGLFRVAEFEERSIVNDIMDATNTFPQMRGMAPERREPATTTLKMQEAGDIRASLMNLVLETQYMEEIAADFVEFNRRFMARDVEFLDADSYGQLNPAQVRVTPESLLGDFSYKAFGGVIQAREVERKQLMEAVMFFSQNPLFMPLIAKKAPQIFRTILEGFSHIKDPERLYSEMDEQALAEAQTRMMIWESLGRGGDRSDPVNMVPAQLSHETGRSAGLEPFPNSPMDSIMNSGAYRQ